MDMGTGKTITTIALAGTLYHKHKVLKLLVVCPKSIVDVWDQEFGKFAAFNYSLAVLDGSSAKKADTIRYMIGNGFDHLFTINTMTLGATVKELKANNDDILPDWLEGVIQIYEQPSIRVAKSRK